MPPATSGAALAGRAKALALEAGFDLAGFARADSPPALAFFGEWVARGHAGEMAYLTSQVRPTRPAGAAGSRATRGATTTTT
jgi:hypothetical protein